MEIRWSVILSLSICAFVVAASVRLLWRIVYKMPSKAAAMTTKHRGDILELRAVQLMRTLGYGNVRRNVILQDKHSNYSEIDVVAGRLRPVYVECKNFRKPIPLKEVAKFAAVLQLNGIPLSRGWFITMSTFSPRCRMLGVRCIDGEELKELERKAQAVARFRWLVFGTLKVLLASVCIVTAVGLVVPIVLYPIAPSRDALRQRVAELITPTSGLRGSSSNTLPLSQFELGWHYVYQCEVWAYAMVGWLLRVRDAVRAGTWDLAVKTLWEAPTAFYHAAMS